MLFCDGLSDAWEDHHHHPTMTLWDRQNSPSNNKIGPLYSLRLLLAQPRAAVTDGGTMPTPSAKEREVGVALGTIPLPLWERKKNHHLSLLSDQFFR
jgi:hypothetical protein